jgi:hypothetical protein
LHKKCYYIHIIPSGDDEIMEQVIKEIFSPSKLYKVQIIKRKDNIFTTEVYMWQEDCGYEYWSPIKQGLSLFDTEESALTIAIEQLRNYSGEFISK